MRAVVLRAARDPGVAKAKVVLTTIRAPVVVGSCDMGLEGATIEGMLALRHVQLTLADSDRRTCFSQSWSCEKLPGVHEALHVPAEEPAWTLAEQQRPCACVP